MSLKAARSGRGCALLGLAVLAACSAHPLETPAVPVSAPPRPAGVLSAGLARADITPPPGPGLMGYGPEGKAARGWRQRLHARALVIEDARGERLGLVTLELGAVSPLLHRAVAARVRAATGLGPDRLLLSATHTHAGPGHHFGHPSYDEFGTERSGYDPAMVTFLADRIARAVIEADSSRTEARAAWGTRAVWHLTMNRSIEPFLRNPAEWQARFRKPGAGSASGGVDSTLAVLRIDVRDAATGAFRPAGAFTVFAMHGTAYPSANELFDADIQAFAARALEVHIDSLNGRERAFQPRAVHLVANSAEGDVGPDLPTSTRCELPVLRRVRRPSGPRTPPGPQLWIAPDADTLAACLQRARAETDRVGGAFGEAVVALFDSLGGHLARDLEVRRVFQVAHLADRAEAPTLCPPQPGVATLGGADAGYTRYYGWRMLGVIDVGFEEDSAHSARPAPKGCQGLKRAFLGRLQRRMIPRFLPDVAQLTLAGIGDMLLVAYPFEATTVVGGRIRAAALAGAARSGARFREALTVGLTNGYDQYIATEQEYALQNYEGASTLYGPGTAAWLAGEVETLAARLPSPGAPSPPAVVPPITLRYVSKQPILPRPDAGPPPSALEPRSLTARWQGDTLFVRWHDLQPGRLVPADGAVLEIRYTDRSGHAHVTWDDDPDLEVWALSDADGAGQLWEARWRPQVRPNGPLQVVLLERPGLSRRSVAVMR